MTDQGWGGREQGWQQQGGFGPARYAPGPGVGAGVVGLICLILSLFVLDWADTDKSGFLDFAKAFRARPDGQDLTFAQNITITYGAWAAFVLFGLTVVLVLLAGLPLPPTAAGNTYARVIGTVVVGLGAVGQIVMMTQLFKGSPTPQFGAWLGVIGWFVVAVGFVLGARPTSARPLG